MLPALFIGFVYGYAKNDPPLALCWNEFASTCGCPATCASCCEDDDTPCLSTECDVQKDCTVSCKNNVFGMKLAPALPPAKQAFRNNSLQSWGVAVMKSEEDSKYHAFVDTLSNNCGLGAWTTNSQIVHAVSSSPAGPFATQDVVLPVFHSNPSLTRHTDGTYLLYTVGQTNETASYQADCRTKPGTPGSCAPSIFPPHCYTGNRVELHYSKSLNGPWELLMLPDGTSDILPGGTNPQATVLANGTVVMAFTGQGVPGVHEGFYVATAVSWKGPYVVHTSPLFEFDGPMVFEDPFLYYSHREERWHALVHQYNRTNPAHQVLVGGFAWSSGTGKTILEDLFGNWTYRAKAGAVFNTTVPFVDGSSQTFARRERPALLFDAHGRPAMLYTGVCEGGGSTNCWTLAQPFSAW
jgi:hypothetical protein